MKKLSSAIALLCLLLNTEIYAQLSISCDHREICVWNSDTESFDICYKYEENSIFKINEEETMFVHVTESLKSAYYIDEKTKNEDSGVWMLSVQSDVGNDYIYFLDLANDEIRVAAQKDGELMLVRFYIKRVWAD